LLYGGFSRGELNIFAGGSGSGKSLVMMNIALNWLQQGLNGVYISLELSEELTALRTDAMSIGMSTKDIRKNIDEVVMRINQVKLKSGTYQVKALPAQSNITDIRSFLKEFQIKTGRKVDFMMIDYLDLLMPVSVKVNPNDQFIKDKYVSEELRNLAKELGVLMVTASQLNRSAVDEPEFDHSHIAGGISKINTADNVFGIFTSRAMRERGRYQLQLMKTRSSSGVGSKIDLEFNLESLRIVDTEQEGDAGYRPPQSQTSNILDQIKNKPADSVPVPETGKINAEINSSRLKNMLSSLRLANKT
jgi:KaiC/GvpD/RAD55 family RecA-like ATPase